MCAHRRASAFSRAGGREGSRFGADGGTASERESRLPVTNSWKRDSVKGFPENVATNKNNQSAAVGGNSSAMTEGAEPEQTQRV